MAKVAAAAICLRRGSGAGEEPFQRVARGLHCKLARLFKALMGCATAFARARSRVVLPANLKRLYGPTDCGNAEGAIAMVHEPSRPATVNSFALPGVAGLLAVGIFAVDTFVVLPGAVAVLYVIVVLLSVNFLRWRGVLLVALGCAALTVLGYLLQHGLSYTGDPFVRLLVSLSAIGATAFLALKNQSVTEVAYEQARLLDLTHDTIFVRDMNNVITYWNQGAELLYGWSRVEAIGQVSHQLMQTIFPAPLEEINAELLGTGRWEGELVHARREGPPLVVASRWSLQRDDRGRPVAILETNNDITDRKRAEEELRRSQAYLTEAQRLSHTGSWAIDRREPTGTPLVRGTIPPVRVRPGRGHARLGRVGTAHPSG